MFYSPSIASPRTAQIRPRPLAHSPVEALAKACGTTERGTTLYDLARVARAQGLQVSGVPVEVVLEYDMEGNRTDNHPIPAGKTDEFQLGFTRAGKDGSKTTYYAFGRDPGGNPTGYYKATRLEDRYGNAMTFQYNQPVTYPDGSTDKLLTSVTDTVGRTTAKGGVTEFTYNQYGQKATMKDAENRTWSYTYNPNGDLTRLTYPDGTYTETTYDSIGRPTQVRDRKGQITTIQYNAVGQPVRIDYLADNTSVTYTYNNDGQVTSVTDARGTTTYTYEASTGRLLSVTDPVVGTVSYEYDLYGSRTKVTMPNGRATRFTYRYTSGGAAGSYAANAHNTALDNWQCEMVADPTGITDADGKKTLLSLDTDGRPLVADSAMTTDGGGNPTTSAKNEWFYDGRGQLSEARASLTGITNPLKYAYTYDDMGNRVTHTKTDENNQSRTESYGYDELYRLTSVTYGDGMTQTYTFDKVGNRLTKTEGANTTNYTYNSVNELTSSSEGSYTYDANGNTLTDAQGRSYVWDQQNRLKQIQSPDGHGGVITTTFTYRFDGLRASKTVNGVTTNYVYDGQTVIGETRSDGTSSWYTPGPNGYISRTDLDSQGNVTNKEWFVYDGLGSCRALVKPNAQGTDAVIVARYDYDVYGAVRSQSGSSSNQFKYVAGVGHPTDEETGLIYMRARYYDPQVGRFVSEDPGQDGGNWYTYASCNPVNMIDEDGEDAEFIGKALFKYIEWLVGSGAAGWVFIMVKNLIVAEADLAAVWAAASMEHMQRSLILLRLAREAVRDARIKLIIAVVVGLALAATIVMMDEWIFGDSPDMKE